MFVGDDVNICCDCRVEFKTQEDDDEDPASSKDSRELVMAAQTIFQMGGANFASSSNPHHFAACHLQCQDGILDFSGAALD